MVDTSTLRWNLADVWETVARLLPEEPAQIHGERRFTWAEFDRRANGLAATLLDKQASSEDRVAQYLRNSPEYVEVSHAALKLGIPSVNTNYRYKSDELLYLWQDADITAVVFHGSFTEQAAELRPKAKRIRHWIHVDDGTTPCPTWATPYEQAVAAGTDEAVRSLWGRSADDLFLLYTGGTTGMPKGVMWRSVDFLEQVNEVSGITYPLDEGVDGIPKRLHGPGRVHISASPMMHGSGLFGAFITMHQGGCVISLTNPGFDPVELLDAIDRYQVSSLVLTGEVFGQRILRSFDANPGRWDTSSMRDVLNSGGMLSEATKRGLLEHWPAATILDGFSSSEGFGLGWSVAAKDDIPATGRFTPGPNVRVLDDDDQPIQPGSGRIGRLAVTNRVPLGYYKDESKSQATFIEIDGARYAVPGDHATLEADGTIQLVGRDSLCITSGGEKVYTEEVEAAVLDVAGITDTLVVGVPDPEWHEIVAAVVSVDPQRAPTAADVIAHVKQRLASYKAPRHVVFVDTVPRGPNGKADYAAARRIAAEDRNRTAVGKG